LDLAQVFHGLAPQFLEAFRQAVRELTVADKQGSESTFLHKRMVQGKDDRVVVDHVKRMAELSRVTDTGDLSQVVSVSLEELHQAASAPVGKPEDDAMLHSMLGRILGDSSEDRESALDGRVDRHEIARFHVRQDSPPRRCEGNEVAANVSLDAEGKIEERLPAAHARLQARERRV